MFALRMLLETRTDLETRTTSCWKTTNLTILFPARLTTRGELCADSRFGTRDFVGWISTLARYTVAYSALVDRLAEVNTLLTLARKLERTNPVANATIINALCRGSVVLLCSHIEGYAKEVGELTLSRIFEKQVCRSKVSNLVSYYASRDLISEIRVTSNNKRAARKVALLFDRDLPLWETDGPHPRPISGERFNNGFASPSFNKIAAYVGRFGYSDFKRDLGSRLAADYSVLKNLIDHIVDIRNKIAHGDSIASKTPGDLLDAIPLVKQFCRAVDDVFSSWCRANLCVIR